MTNPPVTLGDHGQAFALNMRTVRKAREITIDQLADRLRKAGLRVSGDQLTRIEAGQRNATVDEACEIAQALNTKLHRLVLPSHLALVPDRPPSRTFTDHREGEAC